MKKIILLILALWSYSYAFAQTPSAEEQALYDIMMQYRAEKGLPKIPLSPSLTTVAQTHVRDLVDNRPDIGECNTHSWSAKGKWTACCYTPDHKQAAGMWSKPKELTAYAGNGFEIAAASSAAITPDIALQLWKSSSGHNAVIVNGDIWKGYDWKAIGIGIYKGYAVAWFGAEQDPVR